MLTQHRTGQCGLENRTGRHRNQRDYSFVHHSQRQRPRLITTVTPKVCRFHDPVWLQLAVPSTMSHQKQEKMCCWVCRTRHMPQIHGTLPDSGVWEQPAFVHGRDKTGGVILNRFRMKGRARELRRKISFIFKLSNLYSIKRVIRVRGVIVIQIRTLPGSAFFFYPDLNCSIINCPLSALLCLCTRPNRVQEENNNNKTKL